MERKPRSFGTHNGTFHADEVTACALLLLFDRIDRDLIVRSRDLDVLHQCEYICDVGGEYAPQKKIFDHHQLDYTGPLSSAGMILQYLKSEGNIDESVYDYFSNSLIIGVDDNDNGRDPQKLGYCSFSNVITNYTPVRYSSSSEEQDTAFDVALDFALGHLRRLLDRYHYVQTCKETVAKAMQTEEKYMLFEEAMPWQDIYFELGGEDHQALFVIMPTGIHWKLRAIPPSLKERMKVRVPLPEEWAGLLEQDLKKVSGIEGAIFCHKGRFISIWETKEDVMRALEYCLGVKQ